MNRRLLSGTGLAFAAALFVAVNMAANGLLTTWRLDLTSGRLYTLSDGTLNILGNIEEPLQLRYYFSNEAFNGLPQLQAYGVRVREMLDEYVAQANGAIELAVIDPEPFSDAEDEAVAAGVRQVPVGGSGQTGYMGLVGTNTTDDQLSIPLFQPNDEHSLEYDLTQLVYNLAHPRKRAIGVVSTLPIFGSPGNPMLGVREREPWTIVSVLRETYDLRDLGRNVDAIDPKEIDTLLVVHPKNLTRATLYAIDQFVLKGGKAIVFTDPLAEEDPTMPDPETPMTIPERGSNLPEIFAAWGIEQKPDKLAGDIDAAIRVNYETERGPQSVEYLPWVELTPDNFNAEDFITNQLKTVRLGGAGILGPLEDAKTTFTPLLSTGPNSTEIDREGIYFVRDPSGLLDDFKPSGTRYALAARVRGPATTAFPDGRPKDEKDARAPEDPGFVREAAQPINVIVVADTDILSNRFWVQIQNVLGVQVPSASADNADFIANAIDNLGGNDDLISLRSRGQSIRPFDKVEALQREAEAQFRSRVEALETKLAETERKIEELQTSGGDGAMLLSAAQKAEIEKFRQEQIATRKELRGVQRDLVRGIESLGSRWWWINFLLVPGLMAIGALGYAAAKRLRKPRGAESSA